MARHKNVDWHIPDEASIYDRALSVMMDIRDDIKEFRARGEELAKGLNGGRLQEPELPAQFPPAMKSVEPPAIIGLEGAAMVRKAVAELNAPKPPEPKPDPEPEPRLPVARRVKHKTGGKPRKKRR